VISKSYTLSVLNVVTFSKVTFTILMTVNALGQIFFATSRENFREKETQFRENRGTFRKSFHFCERSKKCFRPNPSTDKNEQTLIVRKRLISPKSTCAAVRKI
jgi:hypothetical protein